MSIRPLPADSYADDGNLIMAKDEVFAHHPDADLTYNDRIRRYAVRDKDGTVLGAGDTPRRAWYDAADNMREEYGP